MATELEPARLFTHGIPIAGAFIDAVEIEHNLRALIQTNYTTDPNYPAGAKQGQLRINGTNPLNITLDVFLDGVWQVLTGLGGGGGGASVVMVPFASSMVWTLDHNLGHKPLVQVIDSSFRLLAPVSSAAPPTEPWSVGDVGITLSVSSKSSTQNKNMVPAVTSGNGSPTGLTVAATPVPGSYVAVIVNHAYYVVGDGVTTTDCYFSDNGGATAKALNAIVAGDELIWNGVIAGFDLAITDPVDFLYPEAVASSSGGPSSPSQVGGFVAPWDGFVVGAYALVMDPLTGAPSFDLIPTINATPTTGGVITVAGALPRGTTIQGTTITANNKFIAGQSVQMRLQAGATLQNTGSVAMFLLVQRSDFCYITHVNDNRVTVTHPEARPGFVLYVG